MKNSPLQQHLLNLLSFEGAHAGFDDAVRGLAPELRGKKIKGAPHTAWQVLEHMRIAQWDILEFSRDAKHASPKWPEGYWPKSDELGDAKLWNQTVEKFRSDLKEFERLVADSATDLFAKIPHGDGQTILR